MTSTPQEGEPGPKAPLKPRPRQSLEDGPFVLRSLLDEVPLFADGTDEDIRINCVDYLDHNLYVGTSALELLHFVKIPPDPSDPTGKPVFVLASRLRPAYVEPSGWKGVQLDTTHVKNCNRIGGELFKVSPRTSA